jgi:pilus assembly protein FimV
MYIKSAIALVFTLLFIPLQVQALGLGKLQTTSILNQPFEGEIELLSLDPGEMDSVKVSLASEAAFSRVNVDRPFLLSSLKFETVQKPDGQSVVRVYSSRPISEPYLNFLIEVSWPEGQIVREFSVLLDIR